MSGRDDEYLTPAGDIEDESTLQEYLLGKTDEEEDDDNAEISEESYVLDEEAIDELDVTDADEDDDEILAEEA